jgi:tetratricopeptide (TPR) repeat protein
VDNLVWLHRFRGTRFGDIPAAYDSAVVHAERLVELNPVRGWYVLGRVLWARGEHGLAEEALQRSLALDPNYLLAYLFLGNLYFDLGRHHEGIPLQRRAAHADPRSRHARNLYGFSYFHLGLPELAVQPLDEATALQRDQYNVGGQLAIRLMRGDHADAIAYTDSVWRVDPEPAYTWARVGEAHFMAGNATEAERFYAGALARDSASTNLYTWKSTALPLAYLYVRSGRTAEATPLIARSYAHADQLLKIGQEPWNAYYQYAALALLQGDRASAIRWLRATHLAGMPGPVLIERDPLLADLRGDPEFHEIVRRLEWRAAEQRRRLGAGGSGESHGKRFVRHPRAAPE